MLLSKEKEFGSSETFASKFEDYADSTHYYTQLYTDKDMTSEVEFPLSVKDLFCNNFKFYTTLNECSDKSYFTFTEYFGVKLSDKIPSTVTDIIVPPPSYFGSDNEKETCIYDFRSKYLENITFADGYTEIWDYAFDGNTSLESVSGLDSVTKINEEIALKWLNNGAVPTDTVRNLFSEAGIMKKFADSKKKGK